MVPRPIRFGMGALWLVTLAAHGDALAGDKNDKSKDKAADKKACVDAHASGQALVREGKLQTAREQFIACGRETCPGAIRKDCTQWLAEATENQPSVVIGAKDESGHDTTEVRVLVDGKEITTSLDGRPIDVDPGTHTLRYELKNGKSFEEQVLIRQGEKNRRLSAIFPPAPRPPPPPLPFEVPMVSIVVGAFGIGALGNFAFWGIIGKNKQSELQDTCAPRCAQDDADTMRRDFLLADLSLGIGVVALGTAVVLAMTSQKTGPSPAPTTGLVVGPGGVGLSGRF